MTTTMGAISGRKVAWKKGGPTETLGPPTASRKSGYSVPSSTVAAAAVINRLLSSSVPSRDTGAKSPPPVSVGARTA